MAVSRYFVPQRWLGYDGAAIAGAPVEANVSEHVLSMPPVHRHQGGGHT